MGDLARALRTGMSLLRAMLDMLVRLVDLLSTGYIRNQTVVIVLVTNAI